MDIKTMIIVLARTFTITALVMAVTIPLLKKRQFKQYIREEGPQSHLVKEGTPTMGGLGMFVALIISLIFSNAMTKEVIPVFAMTVLYGAIGFFDDFIKVSAKHNLGLRAWQKLVLQIAFAVALAIYMKSFSQYGTSVWIPFVSHYVDFGFLYVPFVAFVVVAMANSVNLTDGLDGLSSGVTAIIAIFFAIITNEILQYHVSTYSLIIAGVCLGYLIFNVYPAKVFMGDTGSMALGGAIAGIAIVTGLEFMLVIAGLVYVLESLSVIIQVGSYKLRGKRVFKMAPIHHHFEMCGMKETKVVLMFWVFTLVCVILAYLVYGI